MKPPYLPGEDICRVTQEQAEKVFAQTCNPRNFICFVYPSLYKALKLMFFGDIGGLSFEGTIKTEIGQVSVALAVGLLTPAIFNPEGQT